VKLTAQLRVIPKVDDGVVWIKHVTDGFLLKLMFCVLLTFVRQSAIRRISVGKTVYFLAQ